MKLCPLCRSPWAICPECGKIFRHGTAHHCDNGRCVEVNAPLDCQGCGAVVAQSLDGVLDYSMRLHKYEKGVL
jgi:predicted amidophosphoribosyltransferase